MLRSIGKQSGECGECPEEEKEEEESYTVGRICGKGRF